MIPLDRYREGEYFFTISLLVQARVVDHPSVLAAKDGSESCPLVTEHGRNHEQRLYARNKQNLPDVCPAGVNEGAVERHIHMGKRNCRVD